MSASKIMNLQKVRLPYAPVALTVYGSVRELTGGSTGNASDAGTTRRTEGSGSDRAYKENIVQVDRHPAGFGLYLFDYKAHLRGDLGHGRRFGVMADEVEQIIPEAVFRDSDGYRKVNYALLGIKLH